MNGKTPKKIVLLGATGSIGYSTLRVLRQHKDRLRLVGASAQSNAKGLAAVCAEFDVPHAVLSEDRNDATTRKSFPVGTRLSVGKEALSELAALKEADIVLIAVVGIDGLKPALAAIEARKDIALANKELLVLGGSFVIEAARRQGTRLLPADSEHNAIFQCLENRPIEEVEKLILTASGGPFLETKPEDMAKMTPADATRHPNWPMGRKITVDSSTMANKGLELIEAHWLFGLEPERLEVAIHPQSVAHSFVQFIDGSILGQFSPPSMTFAIQHCLLHPERAPSVEPTLDFKRTMRWDFKAPDFKRYPCLRLAYEALRTSGSAPAVFNAANEVAVKRFLNHELPYPAIPRVIEFALNTIPPTTPRSIEDLFAINAATRKEAELYEDSPSSK